MSADAEHRAEILRLIKGSPQPPLGLTGLAERTGLSEEQTRELVEALVRDGALREEGERLIVVEPAASEAPDDRPIP